MEEIIGILLVLCVLVFRVAKKINDADAPVRPARPAQPTATRQSQTLEELFPDLRAASEGTSEEHHVEFQEDLEPIVEEEPTYVYEGYKPIQTGAKPVVSTPIEVEEEVSEKKEKIDPKKLIVYSEIMNRKY